MKDEKEQICFDSGNSYRMFEEVELERKRIARELHDSTIQMLTMLIYKAELCEKLVEKDTIRTKMELQLMIQVLKESIDDIRDTIYNLHPMSIDDLGLQASLERYIITLNDDGEIDFKLEVCGEEVDCKAIIKLALYRIIQECCNNIKKHSKATEALVHIEYKDDEIVLQVNDNGHGIEELLQKNCNKGTEAKNLTNEMDSNKHGYGIPMMKERISLLGGTMSIETNCNGTSINVCIPISIDMEENNETN